MISACVPSTDEFHPEIVPSSVQNMKDAALPAATLKDVALPLNSTPVTAPEELLPGGPGIDTTSAFGVPVPSYNVDVPVPLLPIQNGLVPLNPLPQAFTRFLSWWSAIPGKSETRL